MFKADYLTVCDAHPVAYRSNAAMVAALGDGDDLPHVGYQIPFKERVHDFMLVVSALTYEFVTARELARSMGLPSGHSTEFASLSHHLKSVVDRGLVERRARTVVINGRPTARWEYRKRPMWER